MLALLLLLLSLALGGGVHATPAHGHAPIARPADSGGSLPGG